MAINAPAYTALKTALDKAGILDVTFPTKPSEFKRGFTRDRKAVSIFTMLLTPQTEYSLTLSKQLSHPRILKIITHCIYVENNTANIAVVYEGAQKTLDADLKYREDNVNSFSVKELEFHFKALIEAFVYLQDLNIVHGRVRLDTLFFTPGRIPGAMDVLKIGNFGSYEYVVEQGLLEEKVRGDVFALGTIFYQMNSAGRRQHPLPEIDSMINWMKSEMPPTFCELHSRYYPQFISESIPQSNPPKAAVGLLAVVEESKVSNQETLPSSKKEALCGPSLPIRHADMGTNTSNSLSGSNLYPSSPKLPSGHSSHRKCRICSLL